MHPTILTQLEDSIKRTMKKQSCGERRATVWLLQCVVERVLVGICCRMAAWCLRRKIFFRPALRQVDMILRFCIPTKSQVQARANGTCIGPSFARITCAPWQRALARDWADLQYYNTCTSHKNISYLLAYLPVVSLPAAFPSCRNISQLPRLLSSLHKGLRSELPAPLRQHLNLQH